MQTQRIVLNLEPAELDGSTVRLALFVSQMVRRDEVR